MNSSIDIVSCIQHYFLFPEDFVGNSHFGVYIKLLLLSTLYIYGKMTNNIFSN